MKNYNKYWVLRPLTRHAKEAEEHLAYYQANEHLPEQVSLKWDPESETWVEDQK
jgi:hypothetical protein